VSRNVMADAGFLRDIVSVNRDTIKERSAYFPRNVIQCSRKVLVYCSLALLASVTGGSQPYVVGLNAQRAFKNRWR
jgi:hypothetical protein